MLRRLYHEQPAHFAFTAANLEWAKGQIAKYPEGRQASAVIPLLWRAQEQEGWVSKPAIEEIARMLGWPTFVFWRSRPSTSCFNFGQSAASRVQIRGTTSA